jgi:beta-xylosidase
MSARRTTTALLATLFLAGACTGSGGGGSPSPGGSATPAAGTPTGAASATVAPSPSPSASPAVVTPGPGEFANPVLPTDFPDPALLKEGDTYYAYATGPQAARSKDLVDWEPLGQLTIEDTWAIKDFWAPEVIKTSAGFVMYYTGRHGELLRSNGELTLCIGVAVAASPEGPFVEKLGKPLVCQNEIGGTIDAGPYRDHDGKLYLIFKNDGNCCGVPTKFWIQPLTPDGLKLTGKATDLGVENDETWEGAVIEAPTILHREGTYYLFYSANAYYTADYAVGYATSKKLTGPYVDAPENPIMNTTFEELMADPTLQAAGPGHQTIVEDDDGDLWLVYHAWDREAVGYDMGGQRTMWIDELVFENGKPVIKGPDSQPQPVP